VKLGYFTMPLHPPRRSYVETLKEDRAAILLADRLGFSEAYVGEHVTDIAESVTSCAAFLASLVHDTKTIKLGTGTLNLPNGHPAQLAATVSMLDNMLEGRFIVGISPGGLPSDWEVFENMGKDRAGMFVECINHMIAIWTGEPPYNLQGRFWNISTEKTMIPDIGQGIIPKPYQKPHPPIVVTAVEPFSRGLTEAAKRGVSASPVQSFPLDTLEFDDFVSEAKVQNAHAWIAFGSARDAANMVISFKRLGYTPSMFVARGAEQAEFITRVGQDAEYAIGIAAWTPTLRTPGNAAFVQAYRAKWSAEPDLAAAQGYSACRVLEVAVRRAGSVDSERLRATLERLETETPLGRYRTAPGTGRQIAAQAVLVQILKGRGEIIWPPALATARAVLPYPRWDQRTLMTAGE